MSIKSASGPHNGSDLTRYVFEVTQSSLTYRFEIQTDKHAPGAYWDRIRLEVTGRLQHPEALRGREAVLVLDGSRVTTLTLNEPDYVDFNPGRVGVLNTQSRPISFSTLLPHDVLHALSTWLGAGKLIVMKSEEDGKVRSEIVLLEFREKAAA